MDDLRGSITVSALVGTGAATLGLALAGLVGVGSDLRAADAIRPTTPPIEDVHDTLRDERRSPKWDGHSPLVGPRPSVTPTPTPTPAASAKEL